MKIKEGSWYDDKNDKKRDVPTNQNPLNRFWRNRVYRPPNRIAWPQEQALANQPQTKSNDGYLDKIVKVLQGATQALSIADIQAQDSELPDSNQRMSALLKKLVDAGMVEKGLWKTQTILQNRGVKKLGKT